MPSTINCPTPCSQAPWKHGAHQSPRKACGPKSRRSCLSHLLGRKYTKNLAQTRCSPSCQISMTALNFHSMQSGQNVRKSRKNPLYLWQRLSLATSHIPGAWEAFSMLNEADWGWHRAGKWYLQQRLRQQLYQELLHTFHNLLHLLIRSPCPPKVTSVAVPSSPAEQMCFSCSRCCCILGTWHRK